MSLKFKEGVSVRYEVHGTIPLQAVTVLGMMVASEICKEQEGKDCIITSITDGVHTRGSVHKDGRAFDMRIFHLSNPKKIADALRARLPKDYDVVLEKDHIHVEVDDGA